MFSCVLNGPAGFDLVTDSLLRLFLAEQAPTPTAEAATTDASPKATPAQPPAEQVEEKKETAAMEVVEEARLGSA